MFSGVFVVLILSIICVITFKRISTRVSQGRLQGYPVGPPEIKILTKKRIIIGKDNSHFFFLLFWYL